ncbi:SufE family protein [Microscilla marina]|uniref:Fe-S metabolism associated SufE n=1 Tax=Microscilla marina ATCC 23134 TaxID=313606 RepID=A1ZTR9_MICM2|nr:SufE family protein [Microscilla marina]EAY26171.1 Fe-S metabolism associated SufE [Microscilla marina ATCC 23134]
MSIQEIQDEIIEDFSLFDTWEDKYSYIIEMGKKLAPLSEEYKTTDNKIKGCQSNVWLHTHMEDDKLVFDGDSDSIIVKGLVSLLIRVLSGHKPESIATSELYFIDKIGMKQHLSMTRANGLAAMVKQMKLYGVAYQSKVG